MPYLNKESAKAWRLKNRDSISARVSRWQSENKEKVREYKRKWERENKEYRREYNKRYAKLNPEKVCARVKAYQRRHPERVKGCAKQYRLRCPDKVRETKRKCEAKIMRNNPQARIKKNLRNRIIQALKSNSKIGSSIELLGCSIENFKIYLESLWETGMSWDNYGKGDGKWQIDHVIPCALFDLSKPEHQRRCFHFSNQQPMWETDNNKSGLNAPTTNLGFSK